MKNLLMAVAVGASALGAYADYTPTWRGLPNGYTQVEYVEANGTQYVDLGVNAQSGLSMETDMLWTALPSDGGYCSAKSAAGKWIMPLWYYNGSWMFGYGNYFSTQVPATANTLYTSSRRFVTDCRPPPSRTGTGTSCWTGRTTPPRRAISISASRSTSSRTTPERAWADRANHVATR